MKGVGCCGSSLLVLNLPSFRACTCRCHSRDDKGFPGSEVNTQMNKNGWTTGGANRLLVMASTGAMAREASPSDVDKGPDRDGGRIRVSQKLIRGPSAFSKPGPVPSQITLLFERH